jgi:hypothetical protein
MTPTLGVTVGELVPLGLTDTPPKQPVIEILHIIITTNITAFILIFLP